MIRVGPLGGVGLWGGPLGGGGAWALEDLEATVRGALEAEVSSGQAGREHLPLDLDLGSELPKAQPPSRQLSGPSKLRHVREKAQTPGTQLGDQTWGGSRSHKGDLARRGYLGS